MEKFSLAFFYVTFPDKKTALNISEALVKSGLAACTNVFPISSVYIWEKAFHTDDEFVAVMKTTIELEKELRAQIEKEHPYDCPCIISWEVQVNSSYYQWVESNTKS